MKVCVYAIAKDEAKNVRDWFNSMCEADEIFVLDTGSTDGTPELLRALGCRVAVAVHDPFRFDVARNISMSMTPPDADWLVCTDLDERFNRGWRLALERAARRHEAKGVNSLMCKFITSFHEDGTPMNAMDYWKIHKPSCVKWVAPCHEYLEWIVPRVSEYMPEDEIWLEHHPDGEKSRAYYLPMLERAVKEDRTPRNLFYYGRELLFHGEYTRAAMILMEYLGHPQATWKSERAWAMRFVARCMSELKEGNLAVHWYVRAAEEATDQRESLVEYARFCAANKEFDEAVRALEVALTRTERPKVFFTEDDCWGDVPLRLLEKYKQQAKEAQDAKVAEPDELGQGGGGECH